MEMETTGESGWHNGDSGVACVEPPEKPDETVSCSFIAERLLQSGLWKIPGHAEDEQRVWRISPQPFELSTECAAVLERLGHALYSFYNASNNLYLRGAFPWVNEYLDRGKPQYLIDYGRMNFQRRNLPVVIRPDIILTDDGGRITELDSVPGGIGLTDGLSHIYEQLGFSLLGGRRGMLRGFMQAMRSVFAQDREPTLGIMISEESEDYRSEMEWVASEAEKAGWTAFAMRPEEITFTEDGLFFGEDGVRIEALYRFFELFDLKNIPKAELVMYAAKKKRVVVTPPYKAYLEEKSLLALFHHPLLEGYWREEMGEDHYAMMMAFTPPTWILDNRPAPPHTVIPGFSLHARQINDWRAMKEAGQKERRLVIKPSGFSPLAWGSRGVVVGHDVSQEEWSGAVERALDSFDTLPYVLQRFHEGKKYKVRYYNERDAEVKDMWGRVRLSPYYVVSGGSVTLGGALATICPLDKKLIHGMVDAVMVPCCVAPGKAQS